MEAYSTEIKKLLKITSVVVIILGLFLAVEAIKSFREYTLLGAQIPAMHTITVSGEGEAVAKPDRARFTFSIIEEADTVEVAQEQATEREARALEVLENVGVDADDIRTLNYSLNPRYEFQRTSTLVSGTRALVGYEVRQTVEVKIEDIGNSGTVIGNLGEVGVQNISGLTFEVEDEDDIRAEAREKAIDDAREKAEVLADQLGVSLKRVVSFGEGGGYMPYRAEAMSLGGGLGSASVDAVATPQVPSGENRIVERVSVTYEIR